MSKQYLIFMECGCFKSDSISMDVFELADNNEVGLFDITDPAFPKLYVYPQRVWVNIVEAPGPDG